jgi:hypothetical protein
VIGLQMGTNKGANQSGVNFGKSRSILDWGVSYASSDLGIVISILALSYCLEQHHSLCRQGCYILHVWGAVIGSYCYLDLKQASAVLSSTTTGQVHGAFNIKKSLSWTPHCISFWMNWMTRLLSCVVIIVVIFIVHFSFLIL